MRFIADSMLGRLTTWLRIMGYDTVYEPDISHNKLIERARKEKRVILTRDTRLIKRRTVKDYFFIKSDHFREQLREVVEYFSLDPLSRFLTLCIRCNTPIKDIEKEDVRDKVPPYVFETQERFGICPECKRIYWGATHTEGMKKELIGVFKRRA